MDDKLERRSRTLTEDDVKAIVDLLRIEIKNDMYKDVGKGVFSLIYKGLGIILISFAAWAVSKGYHFKD